MLSRLWRGSSGGAEHALAALERLIGGPEYALAALERMIGGVGACSRGSGEDDRGARTSLSIALDSARATAYTQAKPRRSSP
jgi:hypothetical protein